ncbi:MAG: ECF transporter S component [Actinobacteria bacterium]|nr:ECF transporter S component [Actinomycetota bacterium]
MSQPTRTATRAPFFTVRRISLLAVLIAVTTALTLLVRIPFAPTRGYLTLADLGVFFASFAFGPVVGALAGGLGAGLADGIAGYPQWMVFSLLIHGLQGLVGGFIARSGKVPAMVAGVVAGTVVMVAGYFLVNLVLYGIGPAAAELPADAVQSAVGGAVAVLLTLAVRKAYPPIAQFGQNRTWTE